MERLPRRTPAAQMDIVGLVFDALATMVEDIPIIGDIVGFVASLFGNSSASNARIARLETIVSKGSSGYDDFNRSDTSSLGRGPQMTADWVTGGDGQALGVQGRAAGLVEGALPADGRRWARYPTPASSSTMTADTIVDDKKVDNRACTSVIVAANAAFTEFVYANVFGTGVYLGRGTRSGNSWSFTDWKSNTSYKVGTAERVEVRASGSGIYQLVVDNTVILEHTDTTYPIDVDHRFVGFAIQCWTGILQLPEYGWRLSAFSLKSEAGTFTAIEAVETVANGAATTANGAVTVANGAATTAQGAQTAAENAVGTAVTQATAAATAAATSAAETAAAAIGAAQQQQVNAVKSAIAGVQSGLPATSLDHSLTNHECSFDQILRESPHASTTATNTVDGVFIRPGYSGPRGSFIYATGATPSTPAPLYIYIGRMDPDDGTVQIEHVSPDQTLAITGEGEQIYNFPTDIIFEPSELMWLAIHQPGGNTRRTLYGKGSSPVAREGSLFPATTRTRHISTSVLTAGAVLPKSTFSFAETKIPWFGIGPSTNLPLPPLATYFENFESGVIPPTLSRQAGSAAVVTNGAIMLPDGLISDGRRTYTVTQVMARDDHEVSGQVVAPTTRPQYLQVRSSVDLEIRSDGLTLSRVSNLATAPMTVNSGDVFKLRAKGNVFTALKLTGTDTWTSVLTYTDSSNALPRGRKYRYVSIGLSRDNFLNSGGWEYVLAQDLPDPV